MKRKLDHKQDLWNYNVDYIDLADNSPDFFNFSLFPIKFTAGKNLIKIQSNPRQMLVDSNVYLEFIDSNGEPLYHEVLDDIAPDKSRYIVLYVYPDTPEGEVRFTALGTAKKLKTGQLLNTDKPNIKYRKKIPIDFREENKSLIVFKDSDKPIVSVSERIIPYQSKDYDNQFAVTSSTGNVSYNNKIITANGFEFRDEMIGQSILIPDANDLYPPNNSFNQTDVTHSAVITKIFNANQALVDRDYIVTGSDRFQRHTYKTFSNSNYEIFYTETGSNVSSPSIKSYLYTEFSNLEPNAGDIKRIKAFYKYSGQTNNQYKFLDDLEVQSTNLLIDSSSNEITKDIGKFTTSSIIDNYYQIRYTNIDYSVSMSLNTSSLFNSIETVYNQPISSSDSFAIYPDTNINFKSNKLYNLDLKLYGQTDSSHPGQPLLEIYMSGSSFVNSDGGRFGKLVKRITDKDINNFGPKSYEFTPDTDGTGNVIFKILSGKWFISDIQIKSNFYTGFTPHQVVGIFPTPTDYRYDYVDFKFEYYNVDGLASNIYTEKSDILISGSNTYIQGDDNLLSGSLTLGGSINQGIELIGREDKQLIHYHYTSLIDGQYMGDTITAYVTESVSFGDAIYPDSVGDWRKSTNVNGSYKLARGIALSNGTGSMEILIGDGFINTSNISSVMGDNLILGVNGAVVPYLTAGLAPGDLHQILGYSLGNNIHRISINAYSEEYSLSSPPPTP